MALSDEQRQTLLASGQWDIANPMVLLLQLCITCGKTMEQARSFVELHKMMIGILDQQGRTKLSAIVGAAVMGVGTPCTILDDIVANNYFGWYSLPEDKRQFLLMLQLLREGTYTASNALSTAKSINGTSEQKEDCLFYLMAGATLNEAKTSAGIS